MDLDREIDAELRQLFTSDDRLDVPVRADAEDVIVAGARRVRRRRIVAATASGVVAVVAMVAAGIVVASGDPDAMPPATSNPTTPPETSVSSSTAVAPAGTQPGQVPPASGATTTARTTTPSKKKTTTTTTVTSEPVPPDLGFQTLGPTGFRTVRLGQTVEEARATGLLGPLSQGAQGGCASYELLIDDRATGYVLASDTVQVISVDPAQTPEGVGPGWTVEQVEAVYEDLDEAAAAAGGQFLVSAPGNTSADYRLEFAGGEVTGVTLQATGQTCS